MKRIILLAVMACLWASAPAFAFWGWSDSNNNNSSGNGNGNANAKADARANAEAVFDFNFLARMKATGNMHGNGEQHNDWSGRSEQAPYYYQGYGNAPYYYPAWQQPSQWYGPRRAMPPAPYQPSPMR